MGGTGFRMLGAREAVALGLGHVEEQITGIEQAVDENAGLAFDLAKTLVESTCRSILKDRSVPYEATDDLPRLFKTVTMQLAFLPATASTAVEAGNGLRKTISGLSTAVQGICELRNHCGFASHGSDGPRPRLEVVQALLAAQAADAIVGFIFRVHMQAQSPPASSGPVYEEHSEFNEHVDDLHEIIRIFDGEYQASEVLFALDQDAYRNALAEYEAGLDGGEEP